MTHDWAVWGTSFPTFKDPARGVVLADAEVTTAAGLAKFSDFVAEGGTAIITCAPAWLRSATGRIVDLPEQVIFALRAERPADLAPDGLDALAALPSLHCALVLSPREPIELGRAVLRLGCIYCGNAVGEAGGRFDGGPWRGRDHVHGFHTFPSVLSPPAPDLVIVRGPVGEGSWPMHPAWVHSIRDACGAAGVTFVFLGWGDWSPDERHHGDVPFNDMALFNREENGHEPILLRHLEPDRQENWAEHQRGDVMLYRVGAERAGRLLDGKEHLELPPWLSLPAPGR